MKQKNSICKILQNFTQITVYKDSWKASSVENAESKLLKDAQSVSLYGIAQGIVKWLIGLNTK